MYPAMKVRESVRRRAKPTVKPRKFTTQINTQDLIKKIQVNIGVLSNSLSHWVLPMIDFHTWRCRCEVVSRDWGCVHEASHLMYDTRYFI